MARFALLLILLSVLGMGLAQPGHISQAATPSPTPTLERGLWVHTVQPGETFASLAERYRTSPEALAWANGLSGQLLKVGQELVVPDPEAFAAGSAHMVAPGDTLSELALRYGTSVRVLALANNLSDPSRLQVGQILRLPSERPRPSPSPTSQPTLVGQAQPSPIATPAPPTIIPQRPGLRLTAWARYPIPGPRGLQTVYVQATDLQGKALAGVEIRARLRSAAGERWLALPPTNAAGGSVLSFEPGDLPLGYPVILELSATFQGSEAQALVAFRPWR